MTQYPDSPGHRRVDTSASAASALSPVLGTLQSAVLSAIRAAGEHGLTTNELAAKLCIDRGSIQPRTSELRRMGRIIDSGRRRPNANGKKAIVWIAVEVLSHG